MSWWKKRTGDNSGQQMSVITMTDTTYDDMVKMFGVPHKTKILKNGNVSEAKWNIDMFDIKYTFTMDSSLLANKKGREAAERGEKDISIPIPDISDPELDKVEIQGDRKVAQELVMPLVSMFINNTQKLTGSYFMKRAIRYLFSKEL